MSKDKRNSFWLSIQYSISLIISLINLKINLVSFGSELFGLWIMIAALWGFGAALDFGIGTAVVKYVAEYNQYEKGRINKFLSSSFIVFAVVGVFIMILGNIAGNFIYFHNSKIISTEYIISLKTIFMILGFAFYFQYLTLFVKSIFEGVSNFVWTSKISLVQNFLLLTGVIIVYVFHFNLIALAEVYLISSMLIFMIYLFSLRKKHPDFRINLKYFDFVEVKNIVRFSFSVQTISIFNALIDPAIKFIIGNFYQVDFVSIYEIARRFSIAISSLFFTTFRTILPKASVLKTDKEIKEFLFNEITNLTKIGITYSGLFFGVGSFFIAVFIKLLFGLEPAILIFLILALPESINSFGYPNYMMLLGLGHALFLALLQLINLVVVIVFLISGFLIFKNGLGLLGYFFSVLIGNILILFFIRKKIKINLLTFLRKVNALKLIIHCLLLLVSIILIYSGTINDYLVLALLSLMSVSIFYSDIKLYSQSFMNFINSNFIKQ